MSSSQKNSKNLESIKKPFQFRLVYKKAHPLTSVFFVLYALKNNLNINRLGISCPKSKIPLATKRNHIKRLIKEVLRIENCLVNQGYDIVISVKKIDHKITFAEVKKNISNLFKLKGLYKIKV